MFKNDLTGKRYGKLIVTKFLYSQRVIGKNRNTSHTDTYWECLCDCGNTTKSLTRLLNDGSIKSCGCLPTGVTPTPAGVFNEVYNGYVCRARNKSLDFELSKEEFGEITKKNCFYCGTEPQQIARKDRVYPYTYNGIDRVDSSLGYVSGNVVPCCGKCNKMKLDMSFVEFKEHLIKIIKYLDL